MGHQEHPSRCFDRAAYRVRWSRSGTVSARQAASASSRAAAANFGVANAVAPWTRFAVMCPHAAVLIGVAAWRLRSTDA